MGKSWHTLGLIVCPNYIETSMLLEGYILHDLMVWRAIVYSAPCNTESL